VNGFPWREKNLASRVGLSVGQAVKPVLPGLQHSARVEILGGIAL
jgi:hypothetical protein